MTGGDSAAAVLQKNAIAATLSVHITLSLLYGGQKRHNRRVKRREIIADKLDSLNEARL